MQRDPINFLPDNQPPAPKSTKRKLWWFFIIVAVLCGGIWAVRAVRSSEQSNDPTLYDPVTLEPKKPQGILKRISQAVFTKERTLEGQKDDRINILLLGMGGPGHDGPFLTDTIMIASIKPSTNQVALISIPRDLAVNIPGRGKIKINNANAVGETKKPGWGGATATEVIKDTFNMDIPYYIRIDFKAFEEIINAVGKIKINVDRSFTDHMYPAPNDEYQSVSFTQGVEEMDGERALIYARSRHGSGGEGSDFARARRQQKMLLALKEKTLSFGTLANPVRIHDIIKSVDTHMTTNMEFADMMTLLKMARNLHTDTITTLVLDDGPNGFLKSGYTPEGAFILEPKTGSFDNMATAIHNVFTDTTLQSKDDTPTQAAPTMTYAEIEIQNGTWSVGMAARMKKRLEDRGFHIGQIGNTTDRPQPQSGIYRVGGKPLVDVLDALQKELEIPVRETPPKNIIVASSTDIMIILGEDMKE